MARILLIDDEPAFRGFLQQSLERGGHSITALDRPHGAPDLLAQSEFELVLLDNRMPGMTGIEFLAALEQSGLSVPVILMTGEPTAETAIQAMNLGAFDYVVKPIDFDELIDELEPLIAKAENIVELTRRRVRLPGGLADGGDAGGEAIQLLGRSRPMQDVYKLIGKVAGSGVSVLIQGETGTGKELVARAIHSNSPRRSKPLVAMNCTALNENLLDDELFGREPRAFTGAGDKLRKGRFEYAHGGTLFLDEIGDMPSMLQAKLLRVLENSEVVRIGGNEPIKVDVRIVSATHRDLSAGVAAGQFRQDLMYRLNGVTIHLPPLRQRGPEDLRLLVEHVLKQAAQRAGRPIPTLHEAAWAKLLEYSWPGNIRELQNVIRRAFLICRGSQIVATDIGLGPAAPPPAAADDAAANIARAVRSALAAGETDLFQRLHDMLDLELLRLALAECGGNQVQTARRLGMSRNGLRAKMQALGLE